MRQEWNDIRAWRKTQREALVARRAALEREQRHQWNEQITELLWHGFPVTAGMTVGFCWPFKGEFDARFVIRHFRERGATAALPAVVAKGEPAAIPQMVAGRADDAGRLRHSGARRHGIRDAGRRHRADERLRRAGYRLGYGGRLFRPHAGRHRAAAAGDRRRLRVRAAADDLSAGARHRRWISW